MGTKRLTKSYPADFLLKKHLFPFALQLMSSRHFHQVNKSTTFFFFGELLIWHSPLQQIPFLNILLLTGPWRSSCKSHLFSWLVRCLSRCASVHVGLRTMTPFSEKAAFCLRCCQTRGGQEEQPCRTLRGPMQGNWLADFVKWAESELILRLHRDWRPQIPKNAGMQRSM